MKLLQNSSRTVLLALAAVVLAPSTRMTATSFRAPASEECIISAIAYLQIPGAPPMENGDIDFGCDTGNGYFSPLHLTKGQVKSLKELAGNGDIHFGLSKINIHGASFHDDGSITMSPSQIISIVEEGDEPNPFDRRNKRDLQTGTGNKHFLLFRVTDVNGLVISDSPAVMSDKLYGTYGDRNNLKSQMAACSVGKYTVVPGGKEGFDTSGIESAPGVIDIRLDISLDNLRSTVINAALAKAQEVLRNHFKMPVDTPLTTFVDHTLFSLKDCFQECGWAACASVGSFYQFYVSGFYSFSGIQLHEHGHNMQVIDSKDWTPLFIHNICVLTPSSPLYSLLILEALMAKLTRITHA
ncbi:hypothetical protein HJC23_007819 [Cyclotella cryptica]|uniref:Uncharacterized protein n=1 Tax=Cyclotella cryptica TaxID=29204 RepID=A0ABD3R032_9STRA